MDFTDQVNRLTVVTNEVRAALGCWLDIVPIHPMLVLVESTWRGDCLPPMRVGDVSVTAPPKILGALSTRASRTRVSHALVQHIAMELASAFPAA